MTWRIADDDQRGRIAGSVMKRNDSQDVAPSISAAR